LVTLSPPTQLPRGLPQVGWQLAIDHPAAPAELAGEGIALRRGPFRLEYYDDVAWAAPAPNMVQDLLIAAFVSSGRIIVVGPPSADINARYLLESELLAFQAEYWPKAAAPVVNVQMITRLVALPRRVVVGSAEPRDRVRARGARVDDVLAAFDQALGKVLDDIVVSTLTAGAASIG